MVQFSILRTLLRLGWKKFHQHGNCNLRGSGDSKNVDLERARGKAAFIKAAFPDKILLKVVG
jgi:hypothetical protein